MAIDNNNGWVKLYRKSLNTQLWQNPHLWKLWSACLLKANYQGAWIPVDGITLPVRVERGQFITGRFSLYRLVYPKKYKDNPTPRTLWQWLKKLQQIGNITLKPTNKYTMVTICNYETYQSTKNETNQQPSNNLPQIRRNKKEYSSNSTEFLLSKLLFDEIKKRKSDYRKPDLQEWTIHIDRMIRLDKRDPARIESVIRWCQQDDFWRNNILSTKKLRKQFDQLELRMKETGGVPEIAPLEQDENGLTPQNRVDERLKKERNLNYAKQTA